VDADIELQEVGIPPGCENTEEVSDRVLDDCGMAMVRCARFAPFAFRTVVVLELYAHPKVLDQPLSFLGHISEFVQSSGCESDAGKVRGLEYALPGTANQCIVGNAARVLGHHTHDLQLDLRGETFPRAFLYVHFESAAAWCAHAKTARCVKGTNRSVGQKSVLSRRT